PWQLIASAGSASSRFATALFDASDQFSSNVDQRF
ncbi:MAG: hypothetical protein ACI93T_000780, partial [Porticoccaceae bacterium]